MHDDSNYDDSDFADRGSDLCLEPLLTSGPSGDDGLVGDALDVLFDEERVDGSSHTISSGLDAPPLSTGDMGSSDFVG